MFFPAEEKVVSNLAWFVVIVWIFVVLILTQTYTASLTSMLTLQKLLPTVGLDSFWGLFLIAGLAYSLCSYIFPPA